MQGEAAVSALAGYIRIGRAAQAPAHIIVPDAR